MATRDKTIESGIEQTTQDADPTAFEPLILIPPAVSTLSLARVSNEFVPLTSISYLQRFSGILYSLTASILFTSSTFSIKQLDVDLLDVLLFRFIIQTLVTFVFIRIKNYPSFPGNTVEIFFQLCCCATGAGTFFLYFFAIRYIDLPDVTTLCYTRVVWTMVFSIIVYREWPSYGSLIALPLTLSGVVFVTQPTFLFSSKTSLTEANRWLGISLSMASSIVSSINVLMFKQLISKSKDMKPSVLNFQYCFAVLGFLLGYQYYKFHFIGSGLSWKTIMSGRYVLASMICLVMIAVNVLVQKAIKREHPAIFTLLGSAEEPLKY